MVAVDEELCLGPALAARDRRRVKLVVHAALPLALGVERVARAIFGEYLEPGARLAPEPKQHVRAVVRPTWFPAAAERKRSHYNNIIQ